MFRNVVEVTALYSPYIMQGSMVYMLCTIFVMFNIIKDTGEREIGGGSDRFK